LLTSDTMMTAHARYCGAWRELDDDTTKLFFAAFDGRWSLGDRLRDVRARLFRERLMPRRAEGPGPR
jgi:hypothetical protein